jgi:hypothetical protein
MTTLQTQAFQCNECADRGFVPDVVFGTVEPVPCPRCGHKLPAIDFRPTDAELDEMMLAYDRVDLADRDEELEYDSAA